MTVQTFTPRGPVFLYSAEAADSIARDAIVLASGQNLGSGTVLGQITVGAASVDAGTNTGNGTLTLDATTPRLTDVQVGDYTVTCIGGTYDASIAAASGNTGNGTAAMHTTKTANGVTTGVYKAVFIEPNTNLGTFEVFDPAGVPIGHGVVGTLFDGVVKFTISDGGTDFLPGDMFEITVIAAVPANGGTFRVTDPAGNVLGTVAVGGTFATQIKFVIADGATDFAVNDSFTVTVAAGSGQYKQLAPAAVDGTATATGILWEATDATSAATAAVQVSRLAEVIGSELVWPNGITNDQKATALAQLAAKNIVVR